MNYKNTALAGFLRLRFAFFAVSAFLQNAFLQNAFLLQCSFLRFAFGVFGNCNLRLYVLRF